MNIFDIIVYLALAWAIFNGWRRGLLLQLLSLVAVVAAMYAAAMYSDQVGAMLKMEGVQGEIAGFLIIFVVAVIAISLLGRLLRAVFRFVGLGVIDTLLGILFSVVKVVLIVAVLFSCFDALNSNFEIVDESVITSSRWYEPMAGLVDKLTPYFTELKDKMLS